MSSNSGGIIENLTRNYNMMKMINGLKKPGNCNFKPTTSILILWATCLLDAQHFSLNSCIRWLQDKLFDIKILHSYVITLRIKNKILKNVLKYTVYLPKLLHASPVKHKIKYTHILKNWKY